MSLLFWMKKNLNGRNWTQLCAVLWQSVEQNVLEILRSFQTCSSFWKKLLDIFSNDIQRLFDATQRVASLA